MSKRNVWLGASVLGLSLVLGMPRAACAIPLVFSNIGDSNCTGANLGFDRPCGTNVLNAMHVNIFDQNGCGVSDFFDQVYVITGCCNGIAKGCFNPCLTNDTCVSVPFVGGFTTNFTPLPTSSSFNFDYTCCALRGLSERGGFLFGITGQKDVCDVPLVGIPTPTTVDFHLNSGIVFTGTFGPWDSHFTMELQSQAGAAPEISADAAPTALGLAAGILMLAGDGKRKRKQPAS